MAGSRPLVSLAVAVAIAAPSAALADSAGNNQYSDPFGGSTAPTQTAPAPTQTAPSTPAPTSTAQPTAAASPAATDPAGDLPRTGLDLRLLAGAGVALVAGGALLRRALGARA